MGLNIKNERTHALIRELAAATGQSQTSAVEDAVKHRLEELRVESSAVDERVERMLAIAADFQADLKPETRMVLLTADADLYDEVGLPR
ncbi:type II toxin-antitoxin system VapB family antitoxin [Occultella kanbiaonis]|uniref:type II toxin-antitoxin system VapB family antitoxin n=1 Tax=Occultella kanbiaonis TaxID=2675754 RepID=UPI0013D3968F|nr:type II toxin-antitoxin system VapB family antitoxin [Occultella kanbiaonis]